MKLTKRQAFVIHELWARNARLANGFEDDRRKLTKMMASQFRFDSNDSNWGMKSRDANSPVSKDSIAYHLGRDNMMDVWDWQNGDTRAPQVFEGSEPSWPSISGFFYSVEAVDYLLVENNDDSSDDTEDKADILAEIRVIKAQLANIVEGQNAVLESQHQVLVALHAQIDMLNAIDLNFPEYKGSILGFGVTLKPQKPAKK